MNSLCSKVLLFYAFLSCLEVILIYKVNNAVNIMDTWPPKYPNTEALKLYATNHTKKPFIIPRALTQPSAEQLIHLFSIYSESHKHSNSLVTHPPAQANRYPSSHQADTSSTEPAARSHTQALTTLKCSVPQVITHQCKHAPRHVATQGHSPSHL